MESAEEPAVLDRGRPAQSLRPHVIELHPERGAADSAGGEGPLALPGVAEPDRTLHGGRDRGGSCAGRPGPRALGWRTRDWRTRGWRARRGRAGGASAGGGPVLSLRPRATPCDEPLPLGVPFQQEVEPDFQDLLGARAGLGVGERAAGRLELAQEAVRHRDVEAPQVGGERVGGVTRWRRQDFGSRYGPKGVGQCEFNRLNRRAEMGRCAFDRLNRKDGLDLRGGPGRSVNPGHDLAVRGGRVGPDLGRHRHGLPAGAVEEPRQDGVPALRGEHLRELDDAGDAEPAVPQGLDHLGETLDELRRGLPVVGGALREPELEPEPPPVEVGERQEEVGEGGLLPAKQVGELAGEADGGVPCARHTRTISCGFRASPDAHGGARFVAGGAGVFRALGAVPRRAAPGRVRETGLPGDAERGGRIC